MILTEEQRAALKRVVAYMDEMYAIASPYHGCTEDANILRAMIDGSGTVEPVGGFDLEKARAMICHYRIENPGDADTDCGLEDLIRQANLAEEALDEIERLQLELTQALKDLSSKDEIIEKLKKEFLKSTYERNKIRHGHAWYPGDEDYNEYLQRIDADAHKKSQESLDDVLRGD